MHDPLDLKTNKELSIVEDQFLSKEWVDREKIPTYDYNLNGDTIKIAKLDGEYYLMRRTTKVVGGPIDVLESGRK